MTRTITPEALDALEAISDIREELRNYKGRFEAEKRREYEEHTSRLHTRIVSAVSRAYELGATKNRIREQYGTKDPYTISRLLAEAEALATQNNTSTGETK